MNIKPYFIADDNKCFQNYIYVREYDNKQLIYNISKKYKGGKSRVMYKDHSYFIKLHVDKDLQELIKENMEAWNNKVLDITFTPKKYCFKDKKGNVINGYNFVAVSIKLS